MIISKYVMSNCTLQFCCSARTETSNQRSLFLGVLCNVEMAETIIAFHAFFFFHSIALVWRILHVAATLLRAKKNTRLRSFYFIFIFFIWPLGMKDLIFIKNREQCISSSHDFINSGYSSEADHTQRVDLKHLLFLFA